MNKPEINLHQKNCLSRSETITTNGPDGGLTTDAMKVRDDHHLPYIGDFPPNPSSKNDISC